MYEFEKIIRDKPYLLQEKFKSLDLETQDLIVELFKLHFAKVEHLKAELKAELEIEKRRRR